MGAGVRPAATEAQAAVDAGRGRAAQCLPPAQHPAGGPASRPTWIRMGRQSTWTSFPPDSRRQLGAAHEACGVPVRLVRRTPAEWGWVHACIIGPTACRMPACLAGVLASSQSGGWCVSTHHFAWYHCSRSGTCHRSSSTSAAAATLRRRCCRRLPVGRWGAPRSGAAGATARLHTSQIGVVEVEH